MPNPKIIDISQFEVANKEDMDKFNDVLTKVIVAIAQVSKQLNSTSKLSIEKVTDRKNWDMKDFTPKSGRAAAKMSLQSETPNAKTASILTHLKDRLNDCKPSSKSEKELIELLKGRLVFLGIQSASKIAELSALDHISKIEKSLNNSSDLKSTDDIELLSELPANLKILSHLIKKYSIDTLTDHSPREKYTSDDIGKHNTKVLNLYDKTRKLINTLSQANIISKDMREESIDFLNDSRMCFQHKSNINFDFPTKDPTKKVVRNLSALGLGLVSLTSAVAATACTAVSVSGVTAPATAPAAIGLSLISAGSGGAALSMTALNSAINYWMYDISPSKNEKIGMALGATSIALSGIGFIPAVSNLGSTARIIGEIGNQAYATGTNIYEAKQIVDAVASDAPAQKSFKKHVTFDMRDELNSLRNSEDELHSTFSLSH